MFQNKIKTHKRFKKRSYFNQTKPVHIFSASTFFTLTNVDYLNLLCWPEESLEFGHSVSAQTLWAYLAKTAISVKSSQHKLYKSPDFLKSFFMQNRCFSAHWLTKAKSAENLGIVLPHSRELSSSRKKVGIKFCYFNHYFSVV